MSNKFWVGGGSSANWNATGPTNWGSASNTQNDASVPVSTDDVFFDGVGTGASNSTISTSITVNSLDMTGYTNTLSQSANQTLTIAGANGIFRFVNGMTYSPGSGSAVSFAATSGTTNITSAGKTLANVSFVGSGGTFLLQDALTVSSTIVHTDGTFSANNKNISCVSFSSASSTTRTLTMGSGTWTLTGTGTVWNTSDNTGLTLTANTATIKTTDSSATNKTINSSNLAGFPSIWISTGTSTITFTNVSECKNLDFTGFQGIAPVFPTTIYGNLYLSSGMDMPSASGSAITFASTSGTKTITTNKQILDQPVTFDGVGGTWQLSDNFSVADTRTVTLTNGTLDLNGKTFKMGSFSSSNSNTRTVAFNAGIAQLTTIATSTIWDMATSTNATITLTGGGTIKITGSSANVKTFDGGGLTYGDLWLTNTTPNGELDILGNNTFSDFKCDTPPQTIKFAAGSTNTVTTFTVSGSPNLLTTITSTSASTHTLAKAGGGTIERDYLSISYSIASAANTWYAGTNSTDGGNNTSWAFSDQSVPSANDTWITGIKNTIQTTRVGDKIAGRDSGNSFYPTSVLSVVTTASATNWWKITVLGTDIITLDTAKFWTGAAWIAASAIVAGVTSIYGLKAGTTVYNFNRNSGADSTTQSTNYGDLFEAALVSASAAYVLTATAYELRTSVGKYLLNRFLVQDAA